VGIDDYRNVYYNEGSVYHHDTATVSTLQGGDSGASVYYAHPSGNAVGQLYDGTPVIWVGGTAYAVASIDAVQYVFRCNGNGDVLGMCYDGLYHATLGGSHLEDIVGDPDYTFDGLSAMDINDSGTIVCNGYIIKK
jgi:hypothetical protein